MSAFVNFVWSLMLVMMFSLMVLGAPARGQMDRRRGPFMDWPPLASMPINSTNGSSAQLNISSPLAPTLLQGSRRFLIKWRRGFRDRLMFQESAVERISRLLSRLVRLSIKLYELRTQFLGDDIKQGIPESEISIARGLVADRAPNTTLPSHLSSLLRTIPPRRLPRQAVNSSDRQWGAPFTWYY